MRLIGLAVVLSLSLTLAPLAVEAQQSGKVYRIGYLGTTVAPPHIWEAFLGGLREFGWVEGQTIVIERRNAEERYERLSELAADLVRLRVDIIVAAGPGRTARCQASHEHDPHCHDEPCRPSG